MRAVILIDYGPFFCCIQPLSNGRNGEWQMKLYYVSCGCYVCARGVWPGLWSVPYEMNT